jgi:hypothetical protein
VQRRRLDGWKISGARRACNESRRSSWIIGEASPRPLPWHEAGVLLARRELTIVER